MLIYNKLYLFAALGALAISPAFGQQELGLEDCIGMALDRNIGIRRQGLQVDLAKDNLRTSRAANMPGLEGFFSHNLSSGKTVNYENYTYINTQYQDGNAGIQGTVPVFTGLGNWYLSKSASWAMQSEAGKLEELRKAITIEVTAAYLKVLYSGELLKVAEAKLGSSREQLAVNEGFFEAGRMSKVDVVSIRSQVAQDNLARIQAENDERTATLELARLLCMDGDPDLKLKKPAETDAKELAMPENATEIYTYAAAHNPGIQSAQMLIKSREADLAAARSGFSPSVSLNGILYSRYSELGVNPLNPTEPYSYGSQIADNMYGRVSVNVNIPIFSQLRNRNKVNRAAILADDAKLLLDQKRLDIRQDIQAAWTAAVNARTTWEASAEAVESAAQAYNLSKEKYSAGISSAADFKIAQNQLMQAQVNRIQARYQWMIRAKILDVYLDKPVSLD